MCNFRVGQKVVCVSQRETAARLLYPDIGSVWKVRSIAICSITGKTGIRLAGWRLPENPTTGGEFALYPDCFRPVHERKTDISIFKEMLNPTKQRERV